MATDIAGITSRISKSLTAHLANLQAEMIFPTNLTPVPLIAERNLWMPRLDWLKATVRTIGDVTYSEGDQSATYGSFQQYSTRLIDLLADLMPVPPSEKAARFKAIEPDLNTQFELLVQLSQYIVRDLNLSLRIPLQQKQDELIEAGMKARVMSGRVEEMETKIRASYANRSLGVVRNLFDGNSKRARNTGYAFLALTILSLSGTVWSAWYFLDNPSSGQRLEVIIQVAIMRLVILSAGATLVIFCLRLTRSYLHLQEHNKHRAEVANSFAAFMEGSTDAQRDIILGRMIEALVTFGSTGLIEPSNDDALMGQFSLDTVSKLISKAEK